MYHIDKCLQKAEEYEKKGNKEKAQYFLELAERYEKVYKRIKEIEVKLKRNINIGSYKWLED